MKFQTLQQPTAEALDEHLTDEAIDERMQKHAAELEAMGEVLDKDDIQALEVSLRRDSVIQVIRKARRGEKVEIDFAEVEAALIGFDDPY